MDLGYWGALADYLTRSRTQSLTRSLAHSLTLVASSPRRRARSAKTNFPLVEYELEALQYWSVKALGESSAELARIERSYTLPLGREITMDEIKRGIVITGEALVVGLGLATG